MSQCAVLDKTLDMRPIHAVLDRAVEAGADFGLIPIADCFDEQLAQWTPLELQLAENVEDLAAESLACFLQLLKELAIDVPLASLLRHQVPQVTDLGLADPVNASEALLQSVRIPRQIVVHHQVRALKV